MGLGWASAAVCGLIVLGLCSNALSATSCEQKITTRLANALSTRDVFVLGESADGGRYRGSEAILRRAGFTVERCTRLAEHFDCFPWAGIARAKPVGPFIIEVDWGIGEAPLSGMGLRTCFLTFFGIAFHIGDRDAWVT